MTKSCIDGLGSSGMRVDDTTDTRFDRLPQ